MEESQFDEISASNWKLAANLMQELWSDLKAEESMRESHQILSNPNHTIFFLYQGEDVAGFIYLSLRHDYVEGTASSPVAYIEGVYLRPHFRGMGLGRKLVGRGEEWGRSKGVSEYASDVDLSNEISQAFHQKLGFTEVSRLVCYAKRISNS